MESIQVDYARKVGTDNFGSIGIGGSIKFKPASDDAQKEFDQAFAHLKLIVDAKMAEHAGRSGGVFDGAPEPDLGPQPEWVGQHPERIAALLAPSLPPAPPPAPTPPVPSPQPVAVSPVNAPFDSSPEESGVDNAASANSAPVFSGNPDGQEVYLAKAKVFRSEMKKSSKTNRVYAELRVGHNDLPAYINDQYVTVRVFDPQFAAVVGSLARMKNEETGVVEDVERLNIVKLDFVDLWGAFSAWNTDKSKYDLNATAIQKSK